MKCEQHEVLITMVYRHCYHSECLNDYVFTELQPQCPVCAGPCRIRDRFRYEGPIREESFDSATSTTSVAFPWFAAPTDQPKGYFYAKTELADGSPAALVDPGAWTSAGGQDKARDLAKVAVCNMDIS